MIERSMLHSDSRHKKFELPGARPHYTPDRPGQVQHIFLDLEIDIPHQSCSGTCTTTLTPIRDGIEVLTLDAVELDIQSVTVNGEIQKYDYDGQALQIQLAQQTQRGSDLELQITYQINQPRRGMYFIAPTEHYPDKPTQVWTQGEDEDSRFWFPCFDYPGQLTTSEIRVKVPAAFTAISNGSLIGTEAAGDSKIYHWSQQQVHPTYLMTLAVGQFVELQDSWNGKPVNYYVEPGKEAAAKLSMDKTPRMMAFFSEAYGYDYAYDKYAQVCVSDYIFGGMENTSTTLLTDRCLLDEKAAIDNLSTETLVAHELAHQWFGDLAVIKHWSHAWVKEGMASYAEVLWLTHEYGEDLGAYYLLGQAREYLSEDSDRYRRPLVTNVYREAIELYDSHIYEKGACIYHMMRAQLGEPLFQQAIATFLNNHAHQTVETVDLLRAIEQATGRNLAALFDQYVYRGGHPDYKVSYSWDSDSQLAKLTVRQTQAVTDEELFDLKVMIGFDLGDDDHIFTVRIHEKEQTLYFPLDKKPTFISFDVGNAILKTVTLDYPLPELKAQLTEDTDPISRIYAAQAIAKKGGTESLKALAAALKHDRFWGVRLEIAQLLPQIKLDQVFDVLVTGLQDPEARVRRTTINALTQIKTPASYAAVEAIATGSDASYLVEAASLRALGTFAAAGLSTAPAESTVIAIAKQALETRQGWNEVVRVGAIGALSQMNTSAAALDLLLEYTQLGVASSLRLAAIRSLGAVSTGQEKPGLTKVLNRLRELTREREFFTQISVIRALESMTDAAAIGILQGLTDQAADGRIRRMCEEAIREVQGNIGTAPAIKQIRDELDQLKQENQSLRSRLSKLEVPTQ
ncbi:M1 family metallopeptidase [filamentous cyanobacterium LEGE 11480]|uniref:Aminopeptidase N n=1 Tax=Romeriopsis navalis LEGE 11480 TaxID=2777977 RepID=A0A928VM96_9CYAN|nr:M1 family metallopeptidase [Romeriopsis navalis]MBE9029110.1 M1 family metallopeptidase [Romeriopsis navalis LEGE 11480]